MLLRTIAQLCRAMSSQLRHISTIGKNIQQQYLFHMFSQYGELQATNSWDRLASLGHPSKFQRLSRLGFIAIHRRRSAEVNQTLHDVWLFPGLIHYVCILGALAPNGILPGAIFTLCPSLALSYIGSVTARHSSRGRQPSFAVWYLHATGQPSRSTLGGRTV